MDSNLETLLQDFLSLFKNNKSVSSKNINNSFGQSVLANAKADLGVHEDLGPNDGKRIREYFNIFHAPSGQEWCAAAVSTWMKEAGGGPVAGALGARNIASQFMQANRWVPKEKITADAMTPGNIAIWSRGDVKSWHGHIGVISHFDGNKNFTSIEGNAGPKGDSVVQNSHSITESGLLGIGILSDYQVKTSSLNIIKLINNYHNLAIKD